MFAGTAAWGGNEHGEEHKKTPRYLRSIGDLQNSEPKTHRLEPRPASLPARLGRSEAFSVDDTAGTDGIKNMYTQGAVGR